MSTRSISDLLPGGTRLPEPVPAVAGLNRLKEGGSERLGFVGLDRNERLSPLPQETVEAVHAALSGEVMTTYPSLDDLYGELAEHLGVAPEHLRLTAGSDAAFRALHHCYVTSGYRTVSLDPSYGMFPIYARMFGGDPVLIPFDEHLEIDREALLGAIDEGVRLVLLAEPNQPTGTSLGDDTMVRVLERAATIGALVVVDEAYFPFSRHTVLPWIEQHPNLVVTRTFSKAWGLAGLRIGFAAGAPQVIETLYRVRTAYDINAAAIAAARAVLLRPHVAEQYAEEVAAARERLTDRVLAMGLESLPSRTNFHLLRVAHRVSPPALVAALQERGFLVKGPFSTPGLASCIRVTLGPVTLMDRFADALEDALRELA